MDIGRMWLAKPKGQQGWNIDCFKDQARSFKETLMLVLRKKSRDGELLVVNIQFDICCLPFPVTMPGSMSQCGARLPQLAHTSYQP